MKASNLDLAYRNGINVPPFIKISFEELIPQAYELGNTINSIEEDDIKALSSKLCSLIKDKIVINEELLSRINKLEGDLFAVRSSSNVEDSKNYSFAGQFESYLDIPKEDIPLRIVDCILSLFAERVIKYAIDANVPISTLKMNIIIQRMVKANQSGVLFTANPQGILNERVIVVGRGRGDNIVEDRINTTTYYYSSQDKLYYYEGEEDLLSSNFIQELIETSDSLIKIFDNKLLDIEFAIEDNELFILQIRPITTLNYDNPLILDNSNIVESYPGISLPLTDSFVNLVYSGVFRALAMRILKNNKLLSKCEHVFNNMVGSSNGRMYYKISNWYTVISFLPFSRKIVPIWQEMLGVKVKINSGEAIKLNPFNRLATYINAAFELISVPRNMRKLEKEFIKVNDDFYSKYRDDLTNKELVALFYDIKEKLLACWDVTLLNDMYSFIFTGFIKKRLSSKYPSNYEKISSELISGITNIESMKPIKALAELVSLDKDSEGYKKKYEDYIRVFGDRYLEELKLESKTIRTDNSLLDKKIEEFSKDSDRLSKLLCEQESQETISLKGPIDSFLLHRAVLGIKNRESSRLNRSRIYGMVRGIFLSIGKNFKSANLIADTSDIFYLHIDEVFSLVDNPKEVFDLIDRRKQDYDFYKKLPAYSRIIFSKESFNKSRCSIGLNKKLIEKGILQGTSCSNGIAKGEALIIRDISEIGDIRGKILITKMTDPGWVFLLVGAAGIISEKGSLLSHTAIISRELKIPSIVGVDNALELINDGDMVVMDGSTGVITIEDKTS